MSDSVTPPAIAGTPGEQLRRAREGYGWTLEDVAGNLNLTVEVVRALESGDKEMLPEAAFVRGYLRAYARLMEIDEHAVLASSDTASQESIGSVVPILGKEVFKPKKDRRGLKFSETKKSSWRKPFAVSILVVIAVVAAWWFSGLLPAFQEMISQSGENKESSGAISIPLNTQN